MFQQQAPSHQQQNRPAAGLRSHHHTTQAPVLGVPQTTGTTRRGGIAREEQICYITKRDYDFILQLTAESPYAETGGELWGEWLPPSSTSTAGRVGRCIIKAVTGPGIGARSYETAFYQDEVFLVNAGQYLAQYRAFHIGTWHSHHQIALPVPSGGDERTFHLAMQEGGRKQFIAFISAIELGKAVVRPYFYTNDQRSYIKGKFEWISTSTNHCNDRIIDHSRNLELLAEHIYPESSTTTTATATTTGTGNNSSSRISNNNNRGSFTTTGGVNQNPFRGVAPPTSAATQWYNVTPSTTNLLSEIRARIDQEYKNTQMNINIQNQFCIYIKPMYEECAIVFAENFQQEHSFLFSFQGPPKRGPIRVTFPMPENIRYIPLYVCDAVIQVFNKFSQQDASHTNSLPRHYQAFPPEITTTTTSSVPLPNATAVAPPSSSSTNNHQTLRSYV